MLLLESQRCERAPSQLGDIAVRTIGAAELAAASIWISNWSCMLPVTLPRDGTGRGSAGAFGLLLEAYPSLATWISDRVHAKRVNVIQRSTDDGLRLRVRGLKNIHLDFLRECRRLD
jgi:hypothetical protein